MSQQCGGISLPVCQFIGNPHLIRVSDLYHNGDQIQYPLFSIHKPFDFFSKRAG